MIERILARYGDPDVEMQDGDIEYPLARTNILPLTASPRSSLAVS